MHFFRDLRAHRMGRALGLVFAYVLVVQALLLPLRALAENLPDHDGLLCITSVNSFADKENFNNPLETQARKAERDNGQTLPHHGCETGCLMQPLAALPDVVTQQSSYLGLKALSFGSRLDQRFVFDPFAAPILAQGKAPGAPPLL